MCNILISESQKVLFCAEKESFSSNDRERFALCEAKQMSNFGRQQGRPQCVISTLQTSRLQRDTLKNYEMSLIVRDVIDRQAALFFRLLN